MNPLFQKCEAPSQKHETSLKREPHPPLKTHEPTNSIKIILFSYYYENNIIIFILLEVHAFKMEGVHDKGFTFLKKGVHIFGKGDSGEPPEPPMATGLET